MARRRPAEPTVNPARGAALVVVAVVIGLFLLREGLDTSEAVTTNPSDQGSDSSDSSDSSGTDEGDGTTSTTLETRAPSEVPTIVLNDSGIAGSAATYSDVLLAAGYQLTNPDGANADAEGDAATTIIYFAPGFEADAEAVAAAIGAPDLAPTALPTTPPGPIAGASVVVVLGTDLANVTPTTGAGEDTGGDTSASSTTTTTAG